MPYSYFYSLFKLSDNGLINLYFKQEFQTFLHINFLHVFKPLSNSEKAG